MIVEILYRHTLPSKRILLKHKDIRIDCLMMSLIRIFNLLWKNSNIYPIPYAYEYNILPMGKESGIIEYIDDLNRINLLNPPIDISNKELSQLISTVTGGIAASWVLGFIKDKQQIYFKNSMLITIFESKYFLTPVDITKPILPIEIVNYFEKIGKIQSIKNIIIERLMILRKFYSSIIFLMSLLIDKYITEDIMIRYMKSSLFIGLTEEQAREKFLSILSLK